jgi:hypothetical protein
VETYNNQRPSALPAARAQVPGAPGSFAVADAHAVAVGFAAVEGGWTTPAQYLQIPQQVQGKGCIASTALTVSGSVMVATKGDLGDVRGVPPRGRPV